MSLDFYRKIPKIELHIHLEGSIPLDALWELINKYGGDEDVKSRDALEAKFEYSDFLHFIDTWIWKNRFLREYDDFAFIAEKVAESLFNQNIKYAEMYYSPSSFTSLNISGITKSIRAGLDRVKGTRIALIPDLVRDYGPESGFRTLMEANDVREYGVIGIGIGGREFEFPPQPFSEVYQKARELGFRTTVHAGEAAGPDSIRQAIKLLKPDRIGHGTRAFEDKSVADYLKSSRIPVELCPISNLRTGVIEKLADHPVRRFYELGIPISINTDDPAMFGNSLAEEFESLETVMGFSRKEVTGILLDSIYTTWLPENEKKALYAQFSDEINRLGGPNPTSP